MINFEDYFLSLWKSFDWILSVSFAFIKGLKIIKEDPAVRCSKLYTLKNNSISIKFINQVSFP